LFWIGAAGHLHQGYAESFWGHGVPLGTILAFERGASGFGCRASGKQVARRWPFVEPLSLTCSVRRLYEMGLEDLCQARVSGY
jgi:hypothetical protein